MKGEALDRPRAIAVSLRAPLIVATYGLIFFGGLPALLWTIGGRLDALLGAPRLAGPVFVTAGALVAALGSAWMGWSMVSLGRYGAGWPISHLPPRRLTARGPYAVVRHPIYVGYTLAFSGAGFAAGSVGRGVAAAALLCAGWLVYALAFEEPRLVRRLGATYAAYRAAVPLLPRVLGGGAARPAARVWFAVRPAVERLANWTVLARTGPVVWVTYGALVAAGAAGSAPRVPTPLLSALVAFALVPTLWAVARAAPPAGAVTAIGLLLYSIGRFSVECLREQPRYGPWRLSSGQIGSAITAAAAILLLLTVDGSPGWTAAPARDGAALLALAPASALSATLVFVVCGPHWRRVGSW